jgi:hypothetical protein
MSLDALQHAVDIEDDDDVPRLSTAALEALIYKANSNKYFCDFCKFGNFCEKF